MQESKTISKCRSILRDVKNVSLRKLPSEAHKKAWSKYETDVLEVRTLMY